MAPETQTESDPIIGRTWTDFRVERKLGAGGMGAVYLLRNTKMQESVFALKVLPPNAGAWLQERFQQEARVAAALESHRVVKPVTYGQFDDGVWYIVMEYVDGRDLMAELQAKGPLTAEQIATIGLRCADTLKEAHKKGIVHRDIKPPNIMLLNQGASQHRVKILDWGVARASGTLRAVDTQNKMIIGTPGYMSPEAGIGLGVDGRADVFSLGVVLYELATGELPFPLPRVPEDAPNADAAFRRWVIEILPRVIAPPASAKRPSRLGRIPGALDAAIARALAKEPSERFTMADFHAALHGVLKHLENENAPRVEMDLALSATPPEVLAPHQAPTLSTPAGEIARLVGDSGRTPVSGIPGYDDSTRASASGSSGRVSAEEPATVPGRRVAAPATAPTRRPARWIGSLVAMGMVLAIGGAIILTWTLARRAPTPAPTQPQTSETINPQSPPPSAPPLATPPTQTPIAQPARVAPSLSEKHKPHSSKARKEPTSGNENKDSAPRSKKDKDGMMNPFGDQP